MNDIVIYISSITRVIYIKKNPLRTYSVTPLWYVPKHKTTRDIWRHLFNCERITNGLSFSFIKKARNESFKNYSENQAVAS